MKAIFPKHPRLRTWFVLTLLAGTCALALRTEVRAQVPLPGASAAAPAGATVTPRQDALWRCEFPGGTYMVALRAITSISSHEYIVDAAARVTEITVATDSSVEARFYFLEPVAVNGGSPLTPTATMELLQRRVQEAAASHAPVEPVWQKVVKNYPTTTHAHTVEYRLGSKQTLQQIFQSLEQSWATNHGANVVAEGGKKDS